MAKKTKLQLLNDIKDKLTESIDKEINKESVKLLSESISSKPLWELTGIFESVAYKLTNSAKRRKCLKEYVSVLKGNDDLKRAYVAVGMVNHPQNISESRLFTDTLFHLIQEIDKKNLKRGIDKLRKVVKEAVNLSGIGLNEMEDMFESAKSPIGESLTYLLESKCKASNMVEWCNNLSVISDHIEKNNKIIEESDNKEVFNPSELYEKLNAMIKENDGHLSKVVHNVSEYVLMGKDLEALFEQYKADCVNEIDKVMENTILEEKARLEGMRNSLIGKAYKEETLAEDLIKMSELKDVIRESEKE